jgi:hypothetical protein
MSVEARRRARSAMAATWSHDGGVVQISVYALMHVLKPNPEVDDCPGNGLHLYYLTGVRATNQVIAFHLIYNRSLACDEGTRLDHCDVISITSEPGMTIIMLGRLYFMLSYRVTPTIVTPVQHGRRATARPYAV